MTMNRGGNNGSEKLIEKTLRLGGGYGPVVRQQT